jgi:ribose transport system substrate-binding protein
MGLAVLAVAGCGGGSKDGATTASTADAGSLAKSQAVVDTALSAKGTFKAPAGDAPKPKAGAKIALISCGEQIEGCTEAMSSAKEAAGLLGWTTTLFDTKGDPASAGTGIRQAVANKVDGIFLYAIDCQYAKAPLAEAKAAKIPVYQSQGKDCNADDPKAESLFAGSNVYSEGEDFFAYFKRSIEAETDYTVVKAGGAAKIMYVGDDTFTLSKVAGEASKAAAARCAKCTYTAVTVSLSSIGTKLQGIVQQKLLQNPDTTAIVVPYQDITLGGVNAAVRAANKQGKILVSVGEGGPASMDLVRSGAGTYFGSGLSNNWEGWAAIDGLIRLMAGKEPANSGIGIQLYDADHHVPASGGYVPPVDYEAAYKASWGVGA